MRSVSAERSARRSFVATSAALLGFSPRNFAVKSLDQFLERAAEKAR